MKVNDIVVFKSKVSVVKELFEKDGKPYLKLESLEENPWIYQVPADNATGHIQPLPNQEEMKVQLSNVEKLPDITIMRNAIDKICKSYLDSNDMTDWLILIKALFKEKQACEMSGKRLNNKETVYYERCLSKLSGIACHVFKLPEEECQQFVLNHLEELSEKIGA